MKYRTPLGTLLLVEKKKKLIQLFLPGFSIEKALEETSKRNQDLLTPKKTSFLIRVASQLQEHLKGKRKKFSFLWDGKGTPFQKKVWKQVSQIPFGSTQSYGSIAKKIGNPKASRAVGSAVHQNPLPLIVPCHRVIGSDGKLVGFAGGLSLKRKLLQQEASLL